MTILVFSDDAEAARLLCSAIERGDGHAAWERELGPALARVSRESPPAMIADAGVRGYIELIERVRRTAPWSRIYVMGDRDGAADSDLPRVPKPFDAPEIASLLRRDAEFAELERGQRRLQTDIRDLGVLVQASLEAIIGLADDGTILSWNLGAEAMYGYTEHEVVGRHIGLLEPERSVPRPGPVASETRSLVEARRRRKDGVEILVLISASAVEPSASRLAVAEVSLDITSHRKLERELEHKDRLATIGRLAASMAHEVNNPLSVIRASITLLNEVVRTTDDADLVECVRDMELATERIATFVQHVCGFARRARPQLQDVPLGIAVDIALRMSRPRAKERGVEVSTAGTCGASVPHDRSRLSQAILNLIANAIDAAALGGRHVLVDIIEERHRVRIHVDDDGPGVAGEVIGRLFEPFVTTKPQGEGTGLGLAITRQIVQDHGGSVTVTPRGEAGTRAEIVLLRLDPGAHRVLLLDAEAVHREALGAELQGEGFQVTSTQTAAQASSLLAEQPTSVLVVVPGRATAEYSALLNSLHERPPRPAVIWWSDAPSPAAGVDVVLSTPTEIARVVDAIRHLCVEL